MGRIRSVKPEVFLHEDLYQLEEETGLPIRLAWIGLWTQADREGRFKWRPKQLKVAILPFDILDFGRVLEALERGGFIVRYEVGGKVYGVIPTWELHQKVHHRETESTIPPPPSHSPQVQEPQDDRSMTEAWPKHDPSMKHASAVHEPSKAEASTGKGREGKGKEGKDEPPSFQNPNPDPPPFDGTPEGLAQTWCFLLTRRKLGAPRDLERDMVDEFRELLRLGRVNLQPDLTPERLHEAIIDPARDRGEQFFHFRDRLLKPKARAPNPAADDAAAAAARAATARLKADLANGDYATPEEVQAALRSRRKPCNPAETPTATDAPS